MHLIFFFFFFFNLIYFSFLGEASADSEHQTDGPDVIYDDVPCEEDLSSGEGQS